MSESIDILIQADDQASEVLEDVSNNIKDTMRDASQSPKDLNRAVHSSTDAANAFADALGDSQISGFVSQVGGLADQAGTFAAQAKAGKAGALGFKIGLIGLAVAIGSTVGKAIGDFIFETKKFNREFERAKEASKEFEDQIRKTAATMNDMRKADIELIRDPEKKKAEYQKMLDQLNKDIEGVGKQLESSIKLSDEWDDSWQITGNQKAYAQDAKDQVEIDKQRLSALKEERDAVAKIVSARTESNAQLAAENAAKDKSEQYIQKLKEEVEYLAATKEEQIKLDAARNATVEDRGEAERLMKERDAILEKKKAEEELAAAQKKAKEDAEQQAQKIEDIIKSEKQRLEIRRIEIEQGKEAARIQELINQGVDKKTAAEIAAEEAAVDGMQKKSSNKNTLQASESRLLTRGSGSDPMDKTNRILERNLALQEQLATYNAEQLAAQQAIATNTAKTNNLVATA